MIGAYRWNVHVDLEKGRERERWKKESVSLVIQRLIMTQTDLFEADPMRFNKRMFFITSLECF